MNTIMFLSLARPAESPALLPAISRSAIPMWRARHAVSADDTCPNRALELRYCDTIVGWLIRRGEIALAKPSKLLRALLRVVAGGCFSVLCAASSWAQLVVAVSNTPLSAPFYVAEAKGYFRDEGVAVRLDGCIGGPRCMQTLLDGKAHLATITDLTIMFRSFERSDFRVLATFVSSANDLKLLKRAQAGIHRASDLNGRHVGLVPGSGSEYYLDSFAILNGASPDKILRVRLAPERALHALKSGEVDAVSIWEPYGNLILKEMGKDVVVMKGISSYELTFNLVATQAVAGARDADLARLLRALDKAITHIARAPAEAQALVRSHTTLDEEAVRAIWPDFKFSLSLDQSFIITLESEARWALQRNLVRGPLVPNYLQFLHFGPLSTVKPQAVTVRR